MSLIKPDFSDVKDNVGPGTYKVRVTDAKVDKWETKNGPIQYINWTMETFDETDPKNNGRKVWHKTPIQGGGAFRLQEFFKACMGEEISKDSPDFDTEMLFGKTCQIIVVDGVNRQTGAPTGYTEVKTVSPIQ